MFNEYWKEKSAPRRKSWSSKAKRYIERRIPFEDVRFYTKLPLTNLRAFDRYESLWEAHHCEDNPVAEWNQGVFGFAKEKLRRAMGQHGADLDSLHMSSVCSKMPEKEREIKNHMKLLDFGSHAIDEAMVGQDTLIAMWLELTQFVHRVHRFATDVETLTIDYRQAKMTISRYTRKGVPFAYYEVIPCVQLCHGYPIMMEETSFYQLDVATLLMEMAAECDLRDEELDFYAKKMKINSINLAVTDNIEFEFWDDKKLYKKLEEYVKKGTEYEKILSQVLSPWLKAVNKFVDASIQRHGETVYDLREGLRHLDKQIISGYLKEQGLEGVNLITETYEKIMGMRPTNLIVEYQGHRMELRDCVSSKYKFIFYSNADEERFLHFDAYNNKNDKQHLCIVGITVEALADYIKQMPEVNQQVQDMKAKVAQMTDEIARSLGVTIKK